MELEARQVAGRGVSSQRQGESEERRVWRGECGAGRALAFDLLTAAGRIPQNATRVQALIVPTLRVVTQRLTLCVNVDAERPGRHSHAERWNDPVTKRFSLSQGGSHQLLDEH
jgi:hypothetical protein